MGNFWPIYPAGVCLFWVCANIDSFSDLDCLEDEGEGEGELWYRCEEGDGDFPQCADTDWYGDLDLLEDDGDLDFLEDDSDLVICDIDTRRAMVIFHNVPIPIDMVI